MVHAASRACRNGWSLPDGNVSGGGGSLCRNLPRAPCRKPRVVWWCVLCLVCRGGGGGGGGLSAVCLSVLVDWRELPHLVFGFAAGSKGSGLPPGSAAAAAAAAGWAKCHICRPAGSPLRRALALPPTADAADTECVT